MATRKGTGIDRMLAAGPAGEAYCNAMPMLVGYEGVRDFLACAAHGILIGAIPKTAPASSSMPPRSPSVRSSTRPKPLKCRPVPIRPPPPSSSKTPPSMSSFQR